ncbi:hypothetical protein HDU98_002999 [Podochytrium sp. JEL0797]|nr:hypothetical protein HDU98_002999 [Podochytrium sp. JEL0797]
MYFLLQSLTLVSLVAAQTAITPMPLLTASANGLDLGTHTVFNTTFLAEIATRQGVTASQVSSVLLNIGTAPNNTDILAHVIAFNAGTPPISTLGQVEIAHEAMHHLEHKFKHFGLKHVNGTMMGKHHNGTHTGNFTHHASGQMKKHHEISSSLVMLKAVSDVFVLEHHRQHKKHDGIKSAAGAPSASHTRHMDVQVELDPTVQAQVDGWATPFNISAKALERTVLHLSKEIHEWNKESASSAGTMAKRQEPSHPTPSMIAPNANQTMHQQLVAKVISTINSNSGTLSSVTAAGTWMTAFTSDTANMGISALAVSNIGSKFTEMIMDHRHNTVPTASVTAFANVAFSKGAVIVKVPMATADAANTGAADAKSGSVMLGGSIMAGLVVVVFMF